jgi:hypothetical protein
VANGLTLSPLAAEHESGIYVKFTQAGADLFA